MNISKKLIGVVGLALTALSCQKSSLDKMVSNPTEVHEKVVTIKGIDSDFLKVKVYSNNEVMLDAFDETRFKITPIYEIPVSAIAEGAEDLNSEMKVASRSDENDTTSYLGFEILAQNLPKAALGVKIEGIQPISSIARAEDWSPTNLPTRYLSSPTDNWRWGSSQYNSIYVSVMRGAVLHSFNFYYSSDWNANTLAKGSPISLTGEFYPNGNNVGLTSWAFPSGGAVAKGVSTKIWVTKKVWAMSFDVTFYNRVEIPQVTLKTRTLSTQTQTLAVTYQWLKNGSIVLGATKQTYTVPVGQGGSYSVRATGKGGTLTSKAVFVP
ncbi:MAG: hypothetical protein EAZ08_01365 [Cytophagales bacterium]|nr:MAG: hypothetical protein EAZ08_01365 [Cytophagales bacterium]